VTPFRTQTGIAKRAKDLPKDRHSRLVRALRIALPLIGVLLIVSIFALSNTSALRRGLSLPDAQLADLVTGQRITNPRFSGVTNSGDAYILVADSALPDAPQPRLIDLDNPRTTIDFDSGRILQSQSLTGQVDFQENRVEMTDQVELHTSDGWSAFTEKLLLNYRTGNAHSPGHIFATGPFGTVEAEEMTLTQDLLDNPGGGKGLMRFKRRVKVIYVPKQNEGTE